MSKIHFLSRILGKMKGTIHAERGMIEFFADHEHEFGKEEMKLEKRMIL